MGLVLALIMGTAGATSWQVVGESDDAQVWVDVDSIKTNGLHKEATMFTSYDKPQRFGGVEGVKAITYRSTLAHAHFSCSDKTRALSKLRFFADPDAGKSSLGCRCDGGV
jgi:hypothetical protein